MTAATIPDTDLDWVTFQRQDHTKTCEFRTVPCSAQATHVGYFKTPPWCRHSRNLYCLTHRDQILARAAVNYGVFFCPWCPSTPRALLLRMEAL